MPLSKADYGDFSGSDPLLIALRMAQDYWLPGEAPADPRGPNTTTAAKKPLEVRKLPPVQIDLGEVRKLPPVRIDLSEVQRPTPKSDPLAMGQPQPALPPGWTQESGQAVAMEPGAGGGFDQPGALPGRGERVPMPERGGRVDMPERNPAFHGIPDLFADPELAGADAMSTANILAGASPYESHPTGGAELAFLEGLPPTERLKLETELLNRRKFTPEQEAENRAKTGADLLSMIPGPGNVMSAEMAFDQGGQAIDALGQGDLGGAGVSALLAALGGVGAVTGMPTGRLAGAAAKGASSRTNVFTPVDPDDKITDLAQALYSNAPASWSKKSPDARNKMVAKETGVMFGADGRLIREQPLEGSGLTGRRFTSGDKAPIGDVLEYPALYESMPGLADTPVAFTTQRTPKGQPIAKSNEAGTGFEMTAGTAPDFQRRQFEKLLQYKVNELTGMPAAFKDNLPSQIRGIQDAMDQTRIAMQVGAISPATGHAYIRQLENELRMIETAQSLARSAPEKSPVLKAAGFGEGNYPTPKDVRNVVSRDLHQRNAGNNMAKSALTRTEGRGDPYALAPGARPIPGRNSGQTVAISPMAEQLVIPQPGTDVMDLAKMLANWRQFGAGQGR
jgi:hypothetical protein